MVVCEERTGGANWGERKMCLGKGGRGGGGGVVGGGEQLGGGVEWLGGGEGSEGKNGLAA